MFFVIVTCRSLFWVLCTVGVFMLCITAIATPKWLVGKDKIEQSSAGRNISNKETIGLYNKCIFDRAKGGTNKQRCIVYAHNFGEISGIAWRACIIFLSVALILLGLASIFGIVSFCKQLIRRKSLMNLAGIMQSLAGILLIVVIILFPLGWDNQQVQKLCHDIQQDPEDKAHKFKLGSCSIGIAYWATIGATFGSFFCSIFSFIADKAVFSDRVQEEILEGKQLICVP